MRTANELERLTVAEPELLGQTESFVDPGEQERILERILAADRPPDARRGRTTRRRRMAFVLVGVALAAAVVGVASLGHGSAPARDTRGPHVFHLSGATIQLAGYHFRTPAGFKHSTAACGSSSAGASSGFAAAASADGGCVEAFYAISASGSMIPQDASPVDVGSYQGYFVAKDESGKSALYVVLPKAAGKFWWAALLLSSRGLTEDQLVAVALSGLPG
jgi:hypothetical protein